MIGGGQSVIGLCALFYIYRSAIRCAKFGVAVFKASMLDCWGVSICHGCMCIVLYMKLIWCNGFAEIYAQLEGQSAIGICALFFIYIDLPSVV